MVPCGAERQQPPLRFPPSARPPCTSSNPRRRCRCSTTVLPPPPPPQRHRRRRRCEARRAPRGARGQQRHWRHLRHPRDTAQEDEARGQAGVDQQRGAAHVAAVLERVGEGQQRERGGERLRGGKKRGGGEGWMLHRAGRSSFCQAISCADCFTLFFPIPAAAALSAKCATFSRGAFAPRGLS